MRRQQFKIAGLVLTLAALVSAVILLKTSQQIDEESGKQRNSLTAQGDEEDINGTHGMLLQSDAEIQIEAVIVENESGSCQIERRGAGYHIREFPEGRLDEDMLADVLDSLIRVKVSEELGEQEELEQFGLGTDGTRVHVKDRNGANWEFVVGDMLGGNENRSYVLLKGQVLVAEWFPRRLCDGRKAFYQLNLIDIKADEGGENSLEYVTIGGKHFEEEIRIVQSHETGSGYLMETPAYGEAMFDETDETALKLSIPDSLSRVTAESVICENADAYEREEYGLEEPDAVVRYGIDGEEHIIKVSNVRNGLRYMMADEDPAVYAVEDIRVKSWADAQAGDLRTTYVWLVDIADLDRLVIEADEHRYEYLIEQKETENGELRVYYEEKELDAEGSWLPFYQNLLSMPVLSTKRPARWEEEPTYTILYNHNVQSGKEPVTVELCREPDSGRYVALLNGRFAGVLREDTVKAVMESVDKVNRDGEKR